MNSIEDLLGIAPKTEDAPKGTKFKALKDKVTLYGKELKYPIALLASLTVLTVASQYTLLNEESEYSAKYMYGAGKSEVTQMEKDTHSFLTNSNNMRNELVSVNSQIEVKKKELDDANATVTNLTQGYYFIAYLDSLFNKHGITLDKFDINLQSTAVPEGVLTVDNLVDVQIPKGDYSLLPLDIEFTTTSEGIRKLFNEFYTRRIVYDKNLQVTNNLDNSITVRTNIEFTNATITDAVIQPVQQELQVDPSVNSGTTDDWDLTTDSNANATPTETTGTTETTESVLGGTE